MKKENHPIYWFVINLALLIGSMFMTWFMLGVIDTIWPFSGWNFIFTQLFSAIEQFQNSNYQWLWFMALLEGVAGVFVIGYIIFIIIKIATRKVFTGSKIRSMALTGIAILFLLSDLVFWSFQPHPGYWFFMTGLFSNAILEWEYSRAHVNLLTGKRTRKS